MSRELDELLLVDEGVGHGTQTLLSRCFGGAWW